MSGGGKGGKSGSQIAGFRYFFGIHMGLGRGPVDEIVTAKVGDLVAWQGSITSSQEGAIRQPDLFGGEKKEGGIDGVFSVLMGEATQDPTNQAVSEILTPGVIPGFRRMLTIYFDGMISALNPYPKKWSWRVRRAVQGWDGEVFRPDLAVIVLGGAPPDFTASLVHGDIPYNPPVRAGQPVPPSEGSDGADSGDHESSHSEADSDNSDSSDSDSSDSDGGDGSE